jgi:hypothetical protein
MNHDSNILKFWVKMWRLSLVFLEHSNRFFSRVPLNSPTSTVAESWFGLVAEQMSGSTINEKNVGL